MRGRCGSGDRNSYSDPDLCVHYYNGPAPNQSVYGPPNGGDDTSVKLTNIPDYVIDQKDNQVWEVARYNGQIDQARVYSGGSVGSWKQYIWNPWAYPPPH
jgi:hypothetical protein